MIYKYKHNPTTRICKLVAIANNPEAVVFVSAFASFIVHVMGQIIISIVDSRFNEKYVYVGKTK